MPSLDHIDELLRSGQAGEAQRLLLAHKSRLRRLPDRARLAALFRRAGLAGEALRLLVHRVRPAGRRAKLANPEERLEYAAALIAYGAPREAQSLLRELDPQQVPETSLQRAFALFREWDYAAAIPQLEEFVRAPGLPEYRRRVGEINLAAAYVHERRATRASSLLAKLLKETEREANWRLHANALELSAQAAIDAEAWKEAHAHLSRAERLLADGQGGDALYVRKWRAILALRQSGTRADRTRAERVQHAARRDRDWETVRDLDRELGLAGKQTARLQQLSFGTPHVAYRARLELEMLEREISVELDATFAWKIGTGSPQATLDLRGIAPGLKPGQVVHRVLAALASDFYAPLSPVALFERLHPDRYFNVFSSTNLVHRSILRTRKWLASQLRELRIELVGGAYRLAATEGCAVTIQLASSGPHAGGVFPEGRFVAREYEKLTGQSRRQAQRNLADAVTAGYLKRLGRGKATRYLLLT